MKALKLLIVPLLLCSTQSFAQEDNSLEAYISKNKQNIFELDEERVQTSSDLLKNSWIAPVMLNYAYSVSEAYNRESITEKTSITIDQPIFQSGGIYFGIKFAEASRLYSKYSVDVAKRKLIKDAVSLLMQIKQSDFKIKKQELLIRNAEINLELKKEQYLHGQLDSGFMDNAIIERNIVKQVLFDIEANKERLISKFRVISDIEYESAVLPHLDFVSEDQFLSKNLSYELSKSETEKNRYNKNVTISKYLPKVSVYAGYNWDKIQNLNFGGQTLAGGGALETNYVNYGLRASMPININTYDDIQTSRIDHMKSKILELDKKREIKAIYEQVIQNIENFEKKIALSEENKELYLKLLTDTKELYSAGYKTEYDVDLLKNSYDIQEIDLNIFSLDRQLELLTLYEMYVNEI